MALYTKDDINFHGFLSATREMQGKTLKQVGRGLYTESMIARIEEGSRLPKKLERDRIVARLGVSGDRYEDYLPIEDYEWWVQRQNIVKAVEAKDWESLEIQLMEYKGSVRRTKVEKQFIGAMRFMMLQANHATEDELRVVIDEIVPYTIPRIENKFPKQLLLSVQEINLCIEYVRYHKPQGVQTDAKWRKWRLKHYDNIFGFIEQSCMDIIQKSKVYSKLVYYVCQEYDLENSRITDIQKCLELCNQAVEMLRNSRRMYYLVELLELRQQYIYRILVTKRENKRKLENVDEETLKTLLETSHAWEKMFKELYAEYNVSPYMENFCHLYWETESYCINDVIRIRRKMLGLTQEQLAEGVCSIKTLSRTEQRKKNTQIYEVRGLFEKLGLCPEYVRANVITSEPDVMRLHREVARYTNERNVEKWESGLRELEERLCLDILQNKQIVMREKVLLDLYRKKITEEEGCSELKEILEFTVPIDRVMNLDEWYMTIEEISCLYSIGIRIDNTVGNEYMKFLRRHCLKEQEQNRVSIRLGINELVMTGVASYIGNQGNIQASTELSEKVVTTSLRNRRMPTLARNLYNKYWNSKVIMNRESLARENNEIKIVLYKCILLSDFMKSEEYVEFFKSKLEN